MVSPSTSDAIRFEAVQAAFEGWRVLEVTGRHRERYLHSQLTSDLQSLRLGASQLSALLDATGRIRALFHLQKLEESVRLLVPQDAVTAAVAALEEHVIADDVQVAALEVGRMSLVLGPMAEELRQSRPVDKTFPISGYGACAVVVMGDANLPFPLISPEEIEARRVLSGLPGWGVDASAGMLVNETTLLDTAVSFHKGCYLGQETVAKVASRRGAAFAPMLLEVASPEDSGIETGLEGRSFSVGERGRAGTVRAQLVWQGIHYLLASLWREFRVEGQKIVCRFDDGRAITAEVAPVPLISAPSGEEMANDLYHRAVALFTKDLEDEAVALLRRSIVVCPTFADVYESLGVIFGRHGRHEEAIDLMDQLLRVDPDSVMAHTNKSVYLNQLGRNDEAEDEARAAAAKSLELSRREQGPPADEAGRQEEEGEADRRRREEMFRQVLDLDSADAMANFGMGQLLVERGEFRSALGHLERALEADPGYSAAFLPLGRALEGLGESTRARETYEKGVRVAARKGDMKTANLMQARLATLEERLMSASE